MSLYPQIQYHWNLALQTEYFLLHRPYDFTNLQSRISQPYHRGMIVQLSHPQRQVEIKGPKRTKEVLRELNLVIEAHLVIRGDDLVTEDEMLADADQIEIRPVISGGSNT